MEQKEPWRIDKESVHFKVFKGWLAQGFACWLTKTSGQWNLSEDDLLIRILETIQRINWKVFQILKEKTGKNANLPFVIITDNPFGDIMALDFAAEINLRSDFLSEPALVKKQLNWIGSMRVLLESIWQICAALSGGLVICGSAAKFGIAFYNQFVTAILGNFDNIDKRKNFLRAIIEESFHCFCNQTDEFNNKEMSAELDSLRRIENVDSQTKRRMANEIEEKYGVKRMVEELLQILEREGEDLFSLLSFKEKPV